MAKTKSFINFQMVDRNGRAKLLKYYRNLAKTVNPEITVYEKNTFAKNSVKIIEKVAVQKTVAL